MRPLASPAVGLLVLPVVLGVVAACVDASPMDGRDEGGACVDGDRATIAVLGDMKVVGAMPAQIARGGYASLWEDVADVVAGADVAFANIEGALSCCRDGDGVEHPDPGDAFDGVVYTASGEHGLNFPPAFAHAVAALGVDVVSTANNHMLDREGFGLLRTLDALDAAGLAHAGTRRGAWEPWHAVTEVNGIRIAWLACTEWTNGAHSVEDEALILDCRVERDEVFALLEQLRGEHDAVIALPGGGLEDTLVPDEAFGAFLHELADRGATAVIATHVHNPQIPSTRSTPDGREVPVLTSRGDFFTFVNSIERQSSTIAHLGLVRRPDGVVVADAVAHVPVAWEATPDRAGLYAIDRHPGRFEEQRRLVVARWGAAGVRAPVLPIEPVPTCGRAAPTPEPEVVGAVADACGDDAACGAGLRCALVDERRRVGMCTQACASDDDCTIATGTGEAAVCLPGAFGDEGACVRTCEDDWPCQLVQRCEEHGGRTVCAPHALD